MRVVQYQTDQHPLLKYSTHFSLHLNFYWIYQESYPLSMVPLYQIILSNIKSGWIYSTYHYNTVECGNTLDTNCVVIEIFRTAEMDYNLEN